MPSNHRPTCNANPLGLISASMMASTSTLAPPLHCVQLTKAPIRQNPLCQPNLFNPPPHPNRIRRSLSTLMQVLHARTTRGSRPVLPLPTRRFHSFPLSLEQPWTPPTLHPQLGANHPPIYPLLPPSLLRPHPRILTTTITLAHTLLTMAHALPSHRALPKAAPLPHLSSQPPLLSSPTVSTLVPLQLHQCLLALLPVVVLPSGTVQYNLRLLSPSLQRMPTRSPSRPSH